MSGRNFSGILFMSPLQKDILTAKHAKSAKKIKPQTFFQDDLHESLMFSKRL